MTEPAADPVIPPPPTLRPPAEYRWLNALALVLMVGGAAGIAAIVRVNLQLLDLAREPTGEEAGLLLAGLVLGAAAFVIGLALHVGRSLVVRERLAPGRYRGPSLIALLVLGIMAANLATLSLVTDALALAQGRPPSLYGSIVLLTITQAALLGMAALFVAAPNALAGLRLFPSARLLRSIGLGIAFAVPAWIGAQLLAIIAAQLLQLVGLRPEEGVAEAAINVVDPVVLGVALVVVAPIAEEIFFRGVVYNAWLREYGPWRALIGSAILFALIHGSLFILLPIFALGLALAAIYRWTGSLPASIATHATFNAITLALGLLVRFNVIQLP